MTSDGSGLHFVAEENRTIVDENGDPVDPGKQDALLPGRTGTLRCPLSR